MWFTDDMDKAKDDQSCRSITELQYCGVVSLWQVGGKWAE